MENCIFCKIIQEEIPSLRRFEDENIIAINDINPVKKVHVLFIPKTHIEAFEALSDDTILASVRRGAQKIIEEEKLVGKGYKVLVNGGGAQVINHLHFHLIGPVGLKAEI